MQNNRPTAEQIKYLQHLAAREELAQGWTQNPLAIWHATHPEGTALSEKQLMWRIERMFTGMKSQGWVTETHVEHHYQDDEVNTRTFEETLYRITERGKQVLVESGNSPVHSRRVAKHYDRDQVMNVVMDKPAGKETIVLADGVADGRVVQLPEGHHDQVLFAAGGTTVRYRRSRRPEVDGHAVFVPVEGAAQLADA